MKIYWNSLKLFCKTPSVVIPYIILLAANNTILFRLYKAFVENLHDSAAGKADPYFYFADISLVCFLVFVFFVFISYEFMRKIKEAQMEELLFVKGYQGGVVYLQQLLVLWTAAALHAVNITVYLLLGYHSLNMSSIFSGEMVQIVLINIFLLSLASLGMGFLISKITHRFVGYAVIICIICLILPNTVELLLDWQMSFHIPIFVLRDFIYFIPPDITAYPDPLYGLPLEWYRSAVMLFWVFLSILLCGWKMLHARKKVRLTFSICIAGIMLFMACGVLDKGSVLLMSEHPESSSVDKARYNMNNPARVEEVPFSVSSYDMEFSMGKQLTAEVTLTVKADRALPEYLFTLYHGYKISEIVDNSGKKLSFEQKDDYVKVDNTDMLPVKTLHFSYEGCSPTFYSNRKACFLPGFFPYYPKAGYRRVCGEGGEGYVNEEETEADYRIRGLEQRSVVSNLKENKGILEGRTDNVILVSGYLEEVNSDGISQICYPLQESSYENSSYFVSGEMKKRVKDLNDFLGVDEDWKIDGKKVINIPDSLPFNSVLAAYYECKDYVLINGQVEPYEIVKNHTKAVGKETMKEAFFSIEPDSDTVSSDLTLFRDEEWFQGYDDVSELHDAIVLKMRELGVQYVARKVFHYLNDTEDHTDALTFLKSIE